jgi:unsaturated rhamnogalacturonyl hydrolase
MSEEDGMPVRALRGVSVLISGLTAGSLLMAGPANAAPQPAADPPALCAVAQQMVSVGNYWVANGPDQAPANWQNSTFQVGNLALVLTTGQSNHKTLPWAQAVGYQLPIDPSQPFAAQGEAAGEAYLDLFKYFHPDTPLGPLRDQIAAEAASVQQGNRKYWDSVDDLNMAMPSFARIGVLDGSEADLAAMQTLFDYTEKQAGGRGLFNELTGLWNQTAKLSDALAFPSVGNGWALSALTKVLQVLPENDARRPEYLRVFKKMAATLKLVQRPDGFWNSDLLNPFDHAGPESSGTALLTYGLAWGVNAGVLDPAKYSATVNKGWKALSTKAVQPSGLVGYVQEDPAKPSVAKADDTAAYAVGAYLLAGQQIAKLTPGCALPTP